jgi:hypothetical protein
VRVNPDVLQILQEVVRADLDPTDATLVSSREFDRQQCAG